MAIEVWWASGSPYSWRVLLALELKRLSYTSHLLSFQAGDTKTPAYLAINPRGRVPALRDGDVVVYESTAILTYLDRAYPAVRLDGNTAADAGLIARWTSEYGAYVDPAVEAFILPLYFGRAYAEADAIRAAIPTLHAELTRLDEALRGRTWLVGDAPSQADVAFYPGVMSILRAAGKPAASAFDLGLLPLDARYPNVAAWAERIQALPGYERTVPPHWR